MGFGVYGRKPSSKAGECFSASCWTWRPLLYLIGEQCRDVLDRRTLAAMGSNDGAGPASLDLCDEMAYRLERFLSNCTASEFTRIRRPQILQWIRRRKSNSPYRVSRDQVELFILFLRKCGGFYVIQMAFVSVIFPLVFLNTPWHPLGADASSIQSKPFPLLNLLMHAFCPHEVSV